MFLVTLIIWLSVCQVRRIICQWLASVLHVAARQSHHSSDELPDKDPEDRILDDSFTNFVDTQPVRTTALSDPVLISIRDLLQKKAQREEDERTRLKAEGKIRQEWMLAARVVNRLCFIFFASVMFAVTFVFFFVFHIQH